ncbi:MAG TPA: hypothetical protein VM925_05985 [Labilithrix sp.]|nr:hypothetical protein [Labilithrix sp.]
MLPVQPAETTRALVTRFSSALGSTISLSAIPTLVLKAVGVFDPTMRELAEMTYQWKKPYVVDDTKFRQAFGFGATPWEHAVAETLSWARATWGGPSARAA